ncbi:MAG: serine dehydratase subunit alpha family protein [Bacteroidetes bacterium HGW-Bacteroidetes-19]|nr:MAG: serine dehydratase subunit alpha family protein [Bacteroidetes bacterium HGW-Bacteroidetes-19]
MTSERIAQIIKLVKNEVKPALGCTEPIAVALAVAKSCEIMREKGHNPEFLEVEVSANILKNGMGVGIPGTGMVGLDIAAALAMVCGKTEYNLEVLREINHEAIVKAQEIVSSGNVSITMAQTSKKLYINAIAKNHNHTASTIIQDQHDKITYFDFDGSILFNDCSGSVEKNHCKLHDKEESNAILDLKLDVQTIWDFVHEVEYKEIDFILESVELNKALAKEGIKHEYGLQVGKTIHTNIHKHILGFGLLTNSMAMTAAASDARMAGSILPAMSNTGSGNQGITATLPVVAASETFLSSQEELARALMLSHLVTIHIKGQLGRLSALCGAVVASIGSACGIVYLAEGNYDQVCYAIKNMIGNMTGMVCDGAKIGCALKVASGVSSAVQSVLLAMDNICISENDGIIDRDIEKTIKNLAKIGSTGMQETDDMILKIMVSKLN